MSDASDSVTVYRSMDANAKEDCETILDILAGQGIEAVMLDDSAPGVPEGTYEVQVKAADAGRAEETIAENPLADDVEQVDDSSDLDVEPVLHAEEVEALSVKNLLESNGIAVVLVGTSVLPTMPFEVRVAHEHAERARQLIAEAAEAGPAAAEEESGTGESKPER